MHKKLFFILFAFVNFVGFAQEPTLKDSLLQESVTVPLKGQIINYKTRKPLSEATIFNLNSVIGTVSDDQGNFEIPTKVNDTIYISYLGYQSIKLRLTHDLLKANGLVIELHQKTEQLKEVVVNSNKLIGVLEIDVKNAPKDKYARIHINGLPQTYEVGVRKAPSFNSPVDALFRPIDFIYNKLGKKPKNLRKLKKLKNDEKLRNMLAAKFNRELMMTYLDLDAKALNDLLNECNYSDYFIKSASDLQLLEAVLLCYENYKAIKKGSTIKKEEIKN
ncbi:MAG: carboxypeptidase-like regulatory domain-containing protein [Lutibacter sp.]